MVGNATAAEILAHLNATAFAYVYFVNEITFFNLVFDYSLCCTLFRYGRYEILGSSLGYNSSQLLMHMYQHRFQPHVLIEFSI